MDLKTLVQTFCQRQALPRPETVQSAQDDATVQMWALLNEGQMDLADRYNWPELIRTAGASNLADTGSRVFVHGGGGPDQWQAGYLDEGQTAVDSLSFPTGSPPHKTGAIAPGFRSIVPETFWETTSRIPVMGPLSPTEWGRVTTFGVQPTRFSYKVTNNLLWIYPYSATARFTFQYYSRFTVYQVPPNQRAQEAQSTVFTQDTDCSLFPDRIILQDLRWRWRSTKGLPYAEDQRQVEQMILNYIARAPAPTIALDDGPSTSIVGPGLYVAAGNTIPP